MPYHTVLALPCAVLGATPYARAEILGCEEVDCPIASDTALPTCTVDGKTFEATGVTELRSSPARLFSWAKDVGAEDVSSNECV